MWGSFSTILKRVLQMIQPNEKEEATNVVSIVPELSPEPERKIAWKRSPNMRLNRGRDITAIILHHTGSFNAKGELNWMCDPQAKVSAHYLVDPEGQITQMVKDKNISWHAGRSELDGEKYVNNFSIGIEITGDTNKKPFTDSQLESVSWLVKRLMDKHKIDVSRVVSHREIAPGRKTDLNADNFDWEAFYRSIGAID